MSNCCRKSTVPELLGAIRAAVAVLDNGQNTAPVLTTVSVWETAVDRLLADATEARRTGNTDLASRAETAATRLYFARCGEFEGWRAQESAAALERTTGNTGVGQFSKRAAKGVFTPRFIPIPQGYRKPLACYLRPTTTEMVCGPTARQTAARKANLHY